MIRPAAQIPGMKRRVLNLLTLLSLLLCVAEMALWVRSYWKTDHLRLIGNLVLASDNGDVTLCGPTPLLEEQMREEQATDGPNRKQPLWSSQDRDATEEQDLYTEGFKSEAGRWGFVIGPIDFFLARVYALAPWWSLAVLFGLQPAIRAGVIGAKRLMAARRSAATAARGAATTSAPRGTAAPSAAIPRPDDHLNAACSASWRYPTVAIARCVLGGCF